eukprot:TRINITY_DN2522_c0_g1_i2.p2 TRINITY_DN2522_c0_g1~~TRINITY_DN2522_c0_g1_i2.p2  ORF type:complete len:149 (-),score=9.47 TRINITY_DN2522_c0_g1_i2:97-543(-)
MNQEAKTQLQTKVGKIFLAVAYISTICCLIRTDYNFAFALFGYYLWTCRDDKSNSLLLILINGALLIFDLIWILSVGELWDETISTNQVWQQLKVLHYIVVVLSIINVFVKIALVYFINQYRYVQMMQVSQQFIQQSGRIPINQPINK